MVAAEREIMFNLTTQYKLGVLQWFIVEQPVQFCPLCLDGDTAHAAVLDGNFDEDWGDCLYLQPILHHGEQKTHTVEITILPTEDETPTEFYLMALITA